VRCEDVADRLSQVADGTVRLDGAARRHVEQCLRCQAEVVQYRKLLRALHTMRTEVLNPGPGLVGDLLAVLEEAGEKHAVRSMLSGRRVAYVGGIAAATAAGAAGALVLANLSRRGRFRLAS
jgi:anti-sigma factor RsiW